MRQWEAYEAFVAVVESGSFTAAADRLHVSKSHVSRLVSGLEDKLGSQLLFRTTRHLSPTDLGHTIYKRCIDIFEGLDEIESSAMEFDAVPRGRLRIVASDTFGEACIAPLAAELMSNHEHLEIEVLITDRPVDIVAEGFDLAIRYSSLADSTLRVQKLFELPHICAASPAYISRMGLPSAPHDLINHNCLVSTFGACAPWRLTNLAMDDMFKLAGNWSSNSGPSLVSAALNGIGIVWLPELYLRRHIQSGALVEMLADFRSEPMPVWTVYPARRQTSAKVQLLIDFLKARLPVFGGI